MPIVSGLQSLTAPLTIALLGHSPNSDNLGVGALTVSHLAIVRRVAAQMGLGVRFRIFTGFDARVPYVSGEDVEIVRMRTRRFVLPRGGLRDALRACDLVLDITGGDSFADIYGARRFVMSSLPKLVALAARRPLVLSPQTIGPFGRAWTRPVARYIVNHARAVVARDGKTADFVGALAPSARLAEATDVAFALPYDPQPRAPGARPRIGLNVSGLLFNGGYSRDNMFGLTVDYAALVRSLVGRFLGETGGEVHLVSHVISEAFEVEDDYRVCQRLGAEFPQAVVAPRFESPSQAKSYISGMDLFAGARMHACIAAFSSGVPVVPMAYSRKFAGVFGSLGYDLVADCQAETEAQIVSKAMDAWARRDELRAKAEAGRERAAAKLAVYERLLEECLAEARRG